MQGRGAGCGRAVVSALITACASYGGAPAIDAGSDAPPVIAGDAGADATATSDAGTDGPASCVTLALSTANGGRLPTLAGRASLGGTQLTLLAADAFAFNQSGSATWKFPASTRVTGSYELATGSPVSSGYGDGAAIGFYPGTPGAATPALLGLGAGPGAGAFYDSAKSSMGAASRSTFGLGTFDGVRNQPMSASLPTPPFNRKISFEVTPTKVTVDGASLTTATGPVSALMLAAACTQENPQGFAVIGFTAQACP